MANCSKQAKLGDGGGVRRCVRKSRERGESEKDDSREPISCEGLEHGGKDTQMTEGGSAADHTFLRGPKQDLVSVFLQSSSIAFHDICLNLAATLQPKRIHDVGAIPPTATNKTSRN